MTKSDMIVSKTFSARFIMATMLTLTACIGFLKDKLSDEAFMSIAGAAITGYFLKGIDDNSRKYGKSSDNKVQDNDSSV